MTEDPAGAQSWRVRCPVIVAPAGDAEAARRRASRRVLRRSPEVVHPGSPEVVRARISDRLPDRDRGDGAAQASGGSSRGLVAGAAGVDAKMRSDAGWGADVGGAEREGADLELASLRGAATPSTPRRAPRRARRSPPSRRACGAACEGAVVRAGERVVTSTGHVGWTDRRSGSWRDGTSISQKGMSSTSPASAGQ